MGRWVRTREQAKAARDDARVAARQGQFFAPSAVTVGEYLQQWHDEHTWLVMPSTRQRYGQDIAHYIAPRLGLLPLSELDPAILTRFYRDLREHGNRHGGPLTAKTVGGVHATLHKAL